MGKSKFREQAAVIGRKAGNAATAMAAMLACAAQALAGPAMCTGGAGSGFGAEAVNLNAGTAGSDPGAVMGKILGIVLQIGQYVGAAMFIWGIIQFGLAMKNEDPDSKNKAIMVLLAGALVFSVKTVAHAIGIIS